MDDARDATLRLLADRTQDATLCPSEVARALAAASQSGAADWHNIMPMVHSAVDKLAAEGLVQLSWKGQPLVARGGPYRIGRKPGD